jgi:hypothetical protein
VLNNVEQIIDHLGLSAAIKLLNFDSGYTLLPLAASASIPQPFSKRIFVQQCLTSFTACNRL